MTNPFDQFDDPRESTNVFDQFDEKPEPHQVGVGEAIGRGAKALVGNLAGGAALLAGGIPAQVGNLTGSDTAYSIGDYLFSKAKRATDYAAKQQINPETEKAGPIARIAMGITQAAPAVLAPELAVPGLAIASKGGMLPEVANTDAETAQKLNVLDTGVNTVLGAVPFSVGGRIAKAAGGSRVAQYAASAGTGAALNVGADVAGRAAHNAVTGQDEPLITPESAAEAAVTGALFGVHGTRQERAAQAAAAEANKPPVAQEPVKSPEALPPPVIVVGEGAQNPVADLETQKLQMAADENANQLYADRQVEEQRRELAMNSQGLEVGEEPTQQVTLAQREELPSARGIDVGEPESVTLRDEAIAGDQTPTADGLEVGASSPRLEMLNSMLGQAQSDTARKILQSHIKAEQKRLVDADTQTKNVAAADELRGLANQALQAGDTETHGALMKRADQLAPQAPAASSEAEAILTAAAQPNAGPLTRALARGVTDNGGPNVLGSNQSADRGSPAAGGGEQRLEPQRAGGVPGSDAGQPAAGSSQGAVAGEPLASGATVPVLADASGERTPALNEQAQPTRIEVGDKYTPAQASEKYRALATQAEGNPDYFSTDLAKELFPSYNASTEARRDNNDTVQSPASKIAYDAFVERLRQKPPSPDETVTLLAGGAGSGKSTMRPPNGIVYDATLSDPAAAKRNIGKIVNSGRKAVVRYIFNDPTGAFREMLSRGNQMGRYVRMDSFIKTHEGAFNTVKQLEKDYGHSTKVDFEFYNNTGRAQQEVAKQPHFDYNGLNEKLHAILDAEHAAGKISDEAYKAVAGRSPENPGQRPGVHSESRGGPPDRGPNGSRTAQSLVIETPPPGGVSASGDWKAFPPESGSLGIPRAEMPQIKAEHRGAMVNFLQGRGITHEAAKEVDPRTLKATQAEFSEGKVQQAKDFKGGDRSILVSSDGYVVDGHHQWVAALEDNKPVQAIQLNAPVKDLLPALHEFPSSKTAAGASDGALQFRLSPGFAGSKEGVARVADLHKAMTSRFGAGVGALQKRGVLNIVQSYSDLPHSVQQRIEEKLAPHSAGPEATPRAVYIGDEGKAYMIADLISPKDAPAILLHEVGEHYGLQKMLGDKAYDRLLTEVRSAKYRAPAVKEAWSTVKSNYGHLTEGSDEFVREVVAHVGETADATKLGWFKSMLQTIRQFLFKAGYNMRLTDDDLRGMVSSSLRQAMRETAPVEGGKPGEVNFSKTAATTQGDAPDGVWSKLQEKADYLNAQLLDSFSSLKKAQAGKGISEADDAYAKEQLFHGRTETRLNSLRDSYVKPVAKLIANSGLTAEQVSKFLYAEHAPERNAVIAKKNPLFPDGGSGMTNAEARKVMDSFNPGQRETLRKVSDLVQKMNRQKLDTLKDAGLIDQQTHDTLTRQYKSYVPLKTIDDEEHLGIGQGLDIRGKESREAMGRSSEATDPLAVAIQDATRAVIRAEKNRVAQAFVRTALKNPDAQLWEPANENTLPKRAVIGADGQVKYQTDYTAVYRDPSYFSAKFDGKDQFIHIKDVDLARQMKKLGQSGFGPGLLGDLMRGVSTVTRTLSLFYTQLNPDFALANFVRDIQHSLITGTAQDVKGLSTKIAKAIPGSLKSSAKMAWADLRGHEATGPDAKLYEQFKLDGATTGGYGLENVESIQKGLQRIIDAAEGTNKLATAVELGQKALAPVKAINEVFENATRFAAYKAAIEQGVSRQRAAVIAKNLTVNFNKRGESSPVFNALYAFFNASMQANATVFRAAGKSRYAQAAILGLMAAGAAEELAFNDEKDELGNKTLDYASEFERDRNYEIPFGDKRLKIPVAQGFNVPFMVGRRMARVAQGLETMPHAIAGIFGAALDAFSPIHGGLAPTFAQPVLDAQTNTSFSGGAIAKTPHDKNAPESYSNYPSANKFFVSLAQGLNDMTGGDRLHKGAVDISPEKTAYLVQQYLGGPFTFAMSISNLAEPPTGAASINDIPVARRFVAEKRDSFDDQQAHKIYADAEQRAQSIKGGLATPTPDERRMIGSVQAQKHIVERATARKNLMLKANPTADTSTIDGAIQAANRRAERIYNDWQSTQA